MKELILHLTLKSEGDSSFSPAKLNYLLFRCDFTAYRQIGHPITGYSYLKLPFGPTLKPVQRAFDRSALSAEELQLADQIVEELWESGTSEMSARLHNFIGWWTADDNEVIPYEIIFLGDPTTPVSEDLFEFCQQLEREAE
jgi:hypothetical protein